MYVTIEHFSRGPSTRRPFLFLSPQEPYHLFVYFIKKTSAFLRAFHFIDILTRIWVDTSEASRDDPASMNRTVIVADMVHTKVRSMIIGVKKDAPDRQLFTYACMAPQSMDVSIDHVDKTRSYS